MKRDELIVPWVGEAAVIRHCQGCEQTFAGIASLMPTPRVYCRACRRRSKRRDHERTAARRRRSA